MSDFIILSLIVILIICLIATVVAFVLYSGVFSDVAIKTGSPPIKNVTIAYKFKEGSYKDCGAAYTESCSIGPKLNSIGVFYDDPKERPAEKCRYVVGSILSEGQEQPDEELQKLYEKFGFKVFSMPEVTHAVTASFPCTTPLSHLLGPLRVYPELSCYVQERKLCAFPAIEIYKSDLIHYMMPLSRQTDFFVPEMREEAKRDTNDKESDEDMGSDITGADSNSEASWVSGAEPGESRESSLAPSLTSTLASSLLPPAPPRDQGDGDEPGPQREYSDRGSLGSGSSFEELDLELVVEHEGLEEGEGLGREAEGPVVEEDTLVEAAPRGGPVEERMEPVGDGQE
ncbi:testis-expressed protein 264 homolog [Osmerus eperlanus]|uniref:testis-expressed protein 264 homolog n=1 Tax=Osmerus eperlanus TaxID=29151 RepID=UPI002E133C93